MSRSLPLFVWCALNVGAACGQGLDLGAVGQGLEEMASLVEGRGPAAAMPASARDSRFVEVRDGLVTALREPGPYPSGFRWGRLERKTGKYRQVATCNVSETWRTGGAGQVLVGRADNAYEVNVYVPSKRGLFDGNNDAYVHTVEVAWREGSRRRIQRHAVDRWVSRGSNASFPLPVIGSEVEATVRCSARPGREGRTTVQIQVAEPVVVDDEANPNFGAIGQLLAFGSAVPTEPRERDAVLFKLRELFRSITGRSLDSGPNFDLRRRLEFIDFLMGGTEDDVRRAREELRKTIRELRGDGHR